MRDIHEVATRSIAALAAAGSGTTNGIALISLLTAVGSCLLAAAKVDAKSIDLDKLERDVEDMTVSEVSHDALKMGGACLMFASILSLSYTVMERNRDMANALERAWEMPSKGENTTS